MTKDKISYFLIFLLLFLISFQMSAFGLSTLAFYNQIKNVVAVIMILLFLLNLDGFIKNLRSFYIIKFHFIIILLIIVSLLVLYAYDYNISYGGLRELVFVLSFIVIGINITLSKKQYLRITNFFSLLITLSALSVVFVYAKGFVIHENYLPVPKNQLAPVYSIAFIISLHNGLKYKKILSFINYTCALILVASLLIIRGRSAIVALFLVLFIYVFFFIKKKKYKLIFIIFISIFLVLSWQYIYDSLFLNYDVTDIESISAGRTLSYREGLEFLSDHIIAGNLKNELSMDSIIHNYFLYSLVNYGLFLGGLYLILYISYIVIIIKLIRINQFQYYDLGVLLVTVLFIVSLTEYTYPYSPGSVSFFPFVLLGQSLILNKKNKLI